MSWLDDVVAAYGEPRLKASKPEGVQVRTDEGSPVRRFWVWFPGNRNHNVSIDAYPERNGREAYWVVRVGSHVTGKSDVEMRCHEEPDDKLMRQLLDLADFTREPVHRTGYPMGSILSVSTTWAAES